MNGKSLILHPVGLLLVLLLAACGNNLEADLLTYEESTEQLISLNNEFNDTVNNMNFDKLQLMYYGDEDNKPVTKTSDVKSGDTVNIRVTDGDISAVVK